MNNKTDSSYKGICHALDNPPPGGDSTVRVDADTLPPDAAKTKELGHFTREAPTEERMWSFFYFYQAAKKQCDDILQAQSNSPYKTGYVFHSQHHKTYFLSFVQICVEYRGSIHCMIPAYEMKDESRLEEDDFDKFFEDSPHIPPKDL